MPIYEYQCKDCGKEFEALVRAQDVPQCPACQSDRLEKMLSVFATASSTTPAELASPCANCGNPDGPGACAFNHPL